MTDGDPLRRWLADDLFVLNAVFLVAATSLAIALASCLWHHIHSEPTTHDQQRTGDAPSILSAALSSLRISTATTQQQPLAVPSSTLTPEEKDHKSTRSKERRRRGKDPFRDLFKGGKKSRALLSAIKAPDHDQPPSSADTLLNSSEHGNDSASSTSRSQSPDPARGLLSLDRLTPAMCVESDDGSTRNTTPNSITSSTSAVASSGDTSDHSSSDACSQMDSIRTHSVSPDSMTATDTAVNVSTASTVIQHASEDAPSSPSVSADVRTPQPRDSQAASTSGSCAKLVRARTRLRLAKMESGVKPRLFSSALPDSVASSFSSVASCPSLSITSSTHSTDGAGPSTPTNSRGPTPPPRSRSSTEDPCEREPNTQPLYQSAVSAQIRLASMHGVLEAARVREEQLRVEAEQASKERDQLRWRWNEDAGVWRRREAELQAQIHHLMQQLQAYAVVASFQAQQASNLPSSGFSSPSSPHVQLHPLAPFPLPPAIQAQNSASPPAHVQALLASAPMLTSHPPGFAAPASSPGLGMSPLLWSGMGLCVPNRDPRHGGRRTPDSSASGSSSRDRRRRRRPEDVKSASDESSLGDWDGMEDGSGGEDRWEEEEEDIFRNNALADAILKRPESIRGLGGSVGKRSGMARGRPAMHGSRTGSVGPGVGETVDALKDPAMENTGVVPPLVDRQ